VDRSKAAQQVPYPISSFLSNQETNSLRTESTLARKAYDDAEHSLKLTREEKQRAEEEYADLFDVEGFGREGEWKKLEGLCLEKNTGECVSFFFMFFALPCVPALFMGGSDVGRVWNA